MGREGFHTTSVSDIFAPRIHEADDSLNEDELTHVLPRR